MLLLLFVISKFASCVYSLCGSSIFNFIIISFNCACVNAPPAAVKIVSNSNSMYPLLKKFCGTGNLANDFSFIKNVFAPLKYSVITKLDFQLFHLFHQKYLYFVILLNVKPYNKNH